MFALSFRDAGNQLVAPWRRVLAVMAGSLLALGLTSAPLVAQNDVKINVGIAAAKPGDPIDIPLTFSAGENIQAGSIVAHVAYPKALLEYTDMERGLAVELA